MYIQKYTHKVQTISSENYESPENRTWNILECNLVSIGAETAAAKTNEVRLQDYVREKLRQLLNSTKKRQRQRHT